MWSVRFSGDWVCWDWWVCLVIEHIVISGFCLWLGLVDFVVKYGAWWFLLMILFAVISGDWQRCCWRWIFDCCSYGGGLRETKRTQAREIREDREERKRVWRRLRWIKIKIKFFSIYVRTVSNLECHCSLMLKILRFKRSDNGGLFCAKCQIFGIWHTWY